MLEKDQTEQQIIKTETKQSNTLTNKIVSDQQMA